LFTRFYLPKAVDHGRYRLAHEAWCLWDAFGTIRNKARYATCRFVSDLPDVA
jgi:hypothetical protein